nr:NmrA family NAD(P)-binding protein [Mycobacterium sp. 1423905.2]
MVGATGRHAHWVLPELLTRGVHVRALVRDEQRAQQARDNGAQEAVIGDLADKAGLAEAVTGMDGVFHIGPAHAANEAQLGLSLVNAAKAAGVPKFVYSGVIHPSISAMTNHAAKLAVEEALYSSDIDFTVLQPARFMQNFEQSWSDIVEHDRLAQPYSLTAKFCSVDYRDVAEVAGIAMTESALSRGTFELSAPGMHDTHQTAAIISEVLGRPIRAVQILLDDFAAQLPEGPFRDGMTRMMAHYDRHGLPGGNALVLRAILGREPRSLRGYFQELAAR